MAALDVNVICVDWGVGAFVLYHTAVANVHKVGAFTGKLVNWLVDQGSSVDRFHIVGHSLGSHITGIAGRSVTQGKVSYITGIIKLYIWILIKCASEILKNKFCQV